MPIFHNLSQFGFRRCKRTMYAIDLLIKMLNAFEGKAFAQAFYITV